MFGKLMENTSQGRMMTKEGNMLEGGKEFSLIRARVEGSNEQLTHRQWLSNYNVNDFTWRLHDVDLLFLTAPLNAKIAARTYSPTRAALMSKEYPKLPLMLSLTQEPPAPAAPAWKIAKWERKEKNWVRERSRWAVLAFSRQAKKNGLVIFLETLWKEQCQTL